MAGSIVDPVNIEQINRMDTAAFKVLYSIFYKAMAVYAYKTTQDMNAAEDIVQEIFTGLWEHKRRFDNAAALRAFFYSAVHNAALNYIKHRNIVSEYAQNTVKQADRAVHAPADDRFSEEVYLRLFTAIDALPARQREVFLLNMEGKSNAEIAAVLNMGVETVKTHKRRGMEYLRRHIDMKGLAL